jgi:hypothetical protein
MYFRVLNDIKDFVKNLLILVLMISSKFVCDVIELDFIKENYGYYLLLT